MDYATGEFGGKRSLITLFIDVMAAVGQAYNLKKTPPSVVEKVKLRIANMENNNDVYLTDEEEDGDQFDD